MGSGRCPESARLLPCVGRSRCALYLYDCELTNRAPEEPKPQDQIDLGAYRDGGLPFEVVYVEPARSSAFAMAIEKALQEEGISQADLARRLQVPASVVSRITDPLYFGHTSKTICRVADALDRVVNVSLEPRIDNDRRPSIGPRV